MRAQRLEELLGEFSISHLRRTPAAALSFRRADEVAFLARAMTEVSPGQYTGAIPANAFVDFDVSGLSVSPRGAEYFITARNEKGSASRMPLSGTFPLPVFVPGAGLGRPLVHGNAAEAYRLISVPLALEAPEVRAVLEDDLGPYTRKTWRFFGQTTEGPLLEPDMGGVAIVPGRAYWLLV